MTLGFGLLSAQARPGETDWSRAYEETLRIAQDAERLGFSSVWTTEHHFVDDGYMPSLMVVSAAIAAATERIEIGTGVLLAPLHNPIRLAEDAATVDLISNERLILGLGLGWNRVEFEALGVDISQRGVAMEEILQILPAAWSGKPFRHLGRVFDFPELAVRPTPGRRIPILIGGSAEPAIRRAVRLADGVFANAPLKQFTEQVSWIKDELEQTSRDPAEFRVIHYSVLLPGASEGQALEEALPHQWQMMWKYRDMEASATRGGHPPEAPPMTENNVEALRRRSTIAGTPEQIVERLLEIRRQAGLDIEFAARSYFPTLEYDRQLELMERLANEVAPHI